MHLLKFCKCHVVAHLTENAMQICRVDNDALEAAHCLLQPICLRRLKADVEKSLPARVTHLLPF